MRYPHLSLRSWLWGAPTVASRTGLAGWWAAADVMLRGALWADASHALHVLRCAAAHTSCTLSSYSGRQGVHVHSLCCLAHAARCTAAGLAQRTPVDTSQGRRRPPRRRRRRTHMGTPHQNQTTEHETELFSFAAANPSAAVKMGARRCTQGRWRPQPHNRRHAVGPTGSSCPSPIPSYAHAVSTPLHDSRHSYASGTACVNAGAPYRSPQLSSFFWLLFTNPCNAHRDTG